MAEIERVPLGVLPKFSIPDPLIFVFKNSLEQPRNLTGYTFRVIIEKPGGVVVSDRVGEAMDAIEGKARYVFQEGDLDVANLDGKGTKFQMVAERSEDGVVVRRHISGIAVIDVGSTPASAAYLT